MYIKLENIKLEMHSSKITLISPALSVFTHPSLGDQLQMAWSFMTIYT